MGGKSEPAPTTKSETKTVLSPEQQQLFNLAMPFAQQHANAPLQTYQGPTVAGFTPEQQQAQAAYVTGGNAGQALGTQAGQSQQFMLGLDQLNPGSNPYIGQIADIITGKVQNGLVEKTLPIIRSAGMSAAGPYGGGSTRQQLAEGGAVGDAAGQTADALQQLYFNNYRAGIDNIARAQQLNPSLQAQQLFSANVLDAVGGQKQAMEQALLNEQAQKWMMEQYAPYFRAQEISGLIGALPNTASTVSTSTGAVPQKPGIVTSALGGAASGAAIGSVIPGIGTGIGAVLGGLAGAGSRFL